MWTVCKISMSRIESKVAKNLDHFSCQQKSMFWSVSFGWWTHDWSVSTSSNQQLIFNQLYKHSVHCRDSNLSEHFFPPSKWFVSGGVLNSTHLGAFWSKYHNSVAHFCVSNFVWMKVTGMPFCVTEKSRDYTYVKQPRSDATGRIYSAISYCECW